MRTLGDSPDFGALADYLDFLDVNDLRALGVDTMEPAPMRPAPMYAAARSTPGTAPLAPAQQQYAGGGLVRAAPMAARTTVQYAGGAPSAAGMPASRLVSSMIPAGRVVSLPFGVSRPTLLNPGASIDPGLAPPMGPTMMAAPAQDTSQLQPQSTSYVGGQGTSWTGGQSSMTAQPTGAPADGSSAQGTSGTSSSAFGWLALAIGGYVMWRSL